jgi:hypothetical protein
MKSDSITHMSSHPLSLGDQFASLRASLQAESALIRPHAQNALSAVMSALLIRLLTELEQLFRRWQSRPTAYSGFTRATRIAGLAFIPRALRQPPLPTWLLRLAPSLGLRPVPAPRPQSRATRAHPLRNAPH